MEKCIFVSYHSPTSSIIDVTDLYLDIFPKVDHKFLMDLDIQM